jgi:hypothetical protein
MKILNKEISNVPISTDPLVDKLHARIEFLEGWLSSVLIRDDQKRVDDIQNIVAQINKVELGMIPYYVQDNYGQNYFSIECDPQFKQELAASILSTVRTYFPTYKNSLLESLEKGNSEYSQNYIYVEDIK